VALDALAVYVNKDNPLEQLTCSSRRHLLEGTPAAARRSHLGRPASTRAPMGEADQPLRPQLGLRHLRFFKEHASARATTRTRSRSSRFGLRGAGVTEDLYGMATAHRLQDLRVKTLKLSKTPAAVLQHRRGERVLRQVSISRFLYVYVNQAPGKPLDR